MQAPSATAPNLVSDEKSPTERALTQRGLGQRGLAERAGVDITMVQHLEAGGAARQGTIAKLAEALGVQPPELMRGPPAERES